MRLPSVSTTRFVPPAGAAGFLNAKRIAAEVKEISAAQSRKEQKLLFALTGPVCDGSPGFNLLNQVDCCATCGTGGAGVGSTVSSGGSLVLVAVHHGVPSIVSSASSRPNASAGSASALAFSYGISAPSWSYLAWLRTRRRFVDSVGNMFGPDGEYLGSYTATFANDGYRYYYDGEGVIDYYVTNGSDNVLVGNSADYSADSYAGEDELLSTPAERDTIVQGIYSGTTRPGFYHSSDLAFGIEFKVVAGGSSFWTAFATMRDASTLAVLNRLELATVGITHGVSTKLHVSASPDGSFWVHNCGTKTLFHYVWDGSTIAFTERVYLASGGTSWTGGQTLCKQIYV